MNANLFSMVCADNGSVVIEGELVLVNVEAALALSQQIFQLQGGDLTIDLGGVTRGDSAGLALLIHWVRELHSSGRYLSFIHTPAHLLRLADASDLTNILPFAVR